MAEYWDLYDIDGNKTGETWMRNSGKEMPEGRYHLVADILIKHKDGEFLITLRDPHKDLYPNSWEVPGGSVLAGETPEQGARREMLEETGLVAGNLELISITHKPGMKSVIHAYVTVVDCPKDSVRLQEGETVDYRWVDRETFLALSREDPLFIKQFERYRPYFEKEQ